MFGLNIVDSDIYICIKNVICGFRLKFIHHILGSALDDRNMMNKTNVISLLMEPTAYWGMQSINHDHANSFLPASTITILW